MLQRSLLLVATEEMSSVAKEAEGMSVATEDASQFYLGNDTWVPCGPGSSKRILGKQAGSNVMQTLINERAADQGFDPSNTSARSCFERIKNNVAQISNVVPAFL